MVSEKKCDQCGAQATGLICGYCGALTGSLDDIKSEQQALDEYHKLIQASEGEKRANLLKTGFIPRYPKTLVEAGVRCMPLADVDDTTGPASIAAVQRLEALTTKLKILGQDEQSRTAIVEFKAKIRRFKSADRNLGIGVLVFVVGLIVGIVFWVRAC
jgi:hypothetical protein